MLHTCTSRAYDKTGRSAARRFGVRAWSPVVRTRTNMRVTRTWYTRGTRVRHAWYTRALVKLPLGGTVRRYMNDVALQKLKG